MSWPAKVRDPHGAELQFVRQYGPQAEYRLPTLKTVWVSLNPFGEIVHGDYTFIPIDEEKSFTAPRPCDCD